MAQNKVYLTALFTLLIGYAVLCGCTVDGVGNGSEREGSDVNEKPNEKPVETQTFWRASWGGALEGLPFDRYIPDSMPVGQFNKTGKIVISDTAMLHDFFADTYSLSLNEAEDGWVRDERFSDAIAKYNDTFFESGQLVTFFLTAGGGGHEFRLTGTTYTDGILNIIINYVLPTIGGGIGAPVEWFAIIETNAVPADTAIYVNVTDWLGRVYTF